MFSRADSDVKLSLVVIPEKLLCCSSISTMPRISNLRKMVRKLVELLVMFQSFICESSYL